MASEGNGNLLNGQTLLDGFGFLEGQLIGNAPLIFPGEQQLFMILELTAEFGGYIPVIGQLLALVAEILVIVLQLIDELVSLFEGVPRAQKTGIVAHRFATGNSPISQLVSAQIYQLLNYEGKVLSSSDPADQATYGEIRNQAVLMLTTLGATQLAAKHAIDEVWNNTTGPDEKVPALLDQFLPQGWVLVGNTIIQQMYIDHYNQLVTQGADPKTAAKKATQYVLHHAPQKQLQKIRLYPQPGTNPCPPNQVWDPVTGTCVVGDRIFHPCPQGQHWDDTQGKCVPDVVTNPQDCKPPALPVLGHDWPVEPPTNPDGDELTDPMNLVAYWTKILALATYQIDEQLSDIVGSGGQGGNLDPVTCTQLTAQVVIVVQALNAIALAVTNAPATVVNLVADLQPVVDALAALNQTVAHLLDSPGPVHRVTIAVGAIPTFQPTILTDAVAAIKDAKAALLVYDQEQS